VSDLPDWQTPSAMALELHQPNPSALYSLDATAHLAGVPRRSILIYCRARLVRPVFQPPYGIMVFTEETIYTVRRIEDILATHGVGVAWIKSMYDLADEVRRLRTELYFYRNR